MAPRKNTKSASTPAPVADSKIAKLYTGRKTRAMKAAEEKAGAEAGKTTVNANVTATTIVKAVKPATKTKIKAKAAGLAKTSNPVKRNAAVDVDNATTSAVKTVKPATKAKVVDPIEMSKPVKGNTAVNENAAATDTVEVVKTTTKTKLKSAANALKTLKSAIKTNQIDADASTAVKTTTSTAAVAKLPVTESSTEPVITTAVVAIVAAPMPAVLESDDEEPTIHGDPPAGFDSGKLQAHIDAELTRWQNQQKRKPHLWGTQVVPVCAENMASDFEAMGFDVDKVKELIIRKEPVRIDGLTQRPSAGSGHCVPDTGPEPPKRVRKPRGQGKYRGLVVYEDRDWVLFDVAKPYPTQHGDPPLCITKWARFVPGNARVIVMNTHTQSLRSQATPASLLNHAVDYTVTGPKIVGWTPIPNPNKKKTAPPAAPSVPPLLGRGAKRNAARVVSSAAPPPPTSGAQAPKKPSTSAPKKRKADEISASEPPASPSAPVAAAPLPAAATKKRKIAPVVASPSPPSAVVPAPVVPPAPVAPLAGVKRKRRATRPKKTPAVVENSSSE